jgi:hypothetical protein
MESLSEFGTGAISTIALSCSHIIALYGGNFGKLATPLSNRALTFTVTVARTRQDPAAQQNINYDHDHFISSLKKH